jgi:hypothetical protein
MENPAVENPDEITRWLATKGRSALTLEAARQLAAESPDHWYVAPQGNQGYIVGKMTLQKYSARHILVGENGQPVLFATIAAATAFLRTDLKIAQPHVFSV